VTSETRAVMGDLLRESRGVVMTTMTGEGIPESRMIFNLRNEGEFPGLKSFFREPDIEGRFLFGTNTSSEKIAQLKGDGRVTMYYCIPEKFKGMMVYGKARILDDPDLKKRMWLEGWTIYYHQGPTDPDYTIFELIPEYVKGWHESRPFRETVG